MSQLQNIAQVFQNNDLVTAAKLNALVTQTTLTTEAVTSQATPSNNLSDSDVVLGYESSTDTLVQIPISQLITLGGDVSTNQVQPFEDSDIKVSQTYENRSLVLESLSTGGSIVLNNGVGQIVFNAGFSSRQYSKFDFNGAPMNVQESINATGAGIVMNMSSVVGSPIVAFTSSGTHGFSGTDVIEFDGPTAEFDGIFPISNVTSTGFNMTLPANATVAYTNTAVLVRRPALRTQQLAYLSRLRVLGAARFDVAPTLNTSAIKPRFDYFVQTRDNTEYSFTWGGAQNPSNPFGTKIAVLDITFTPQKAGNTVVLDWSIFGEPWNSMADMVFVVTRTPNSGAGAGVPVALPNSVDSSNNTWSGVTGGVYDQNEGTTPSNHRIKIVDFNTLSVSCTYSVHVRAANNRACAFRLNRQINPNPASGGLDNETGLSVGHAHEIYV